MLLVATLSSSFAVCLFPPFFPRDATFSHVVNVQGDHSERENLPLTKIWEFRKLPYPGRMTKHPKSESTRGFFTVWMYHPVVVFVQITENVAIRRISEEAGFGASVYGFIIGTNCLTSFLVTPFIGKQLKGPYLYDVHSTYKVTFQRGSGSQ